MAIKDCTTLIKGNRWPSGIVLRSRNYQRRSVHLPIRIEVEEGRDVKDLSVAAAHRPLVRVHRVAAAVPSIDLDAHVLRPELLEIARDHKNAEQSQVAISGCNLSSNLSRFSLSCNQGYSVA